MSHIARFNLTLQDEESLRAALEELGCTVYEGKMKNYSGSWISNVDSYSYAREHRGKEVKFGFSITRNGRTVDRFGFVENEDGSLELIGDQYGMGMSTREITNIIENAYANARVETTVVPMLEGLGFAENMVESEIELVQLNN